MRTLVSVVLFASILSSQTVLAQETEEDSPTGTKTGTTTSEPREQDRDPETDADSGQQETEPAPLREGYQPREELSKDKGAAFPADI